MWAKPWENETSVMYRKKILKLDWSRVRLGTWTRWWIQVMIQWFSVSESEGTLIEFCCNRDAKGSNLVAFFRSKTSHLRPELSWAGLKCCRRSGFWRISYFVMYSRSFGSRFAPSSPWTSWWQTCLEPGSSHSNLDGPSTGKLQSSLASGLD